MIYKYARVPITDRSLTVQQKGGGWGVKKGRSVGTEKVAWKEDLKYRDLESCQEKVRAGGLVWGGRLFWKNAWGRQDLRRRKLRV